MEKKCPLIKKKRKECPLIGLWLRPPCEDVMTQALERDLVLLQDREPLCRVMEENRGVGPWPGVTFNTEGREQARFLGVGGWTLDSWSGRGAMEKQTRLLCSRLGLGSRECDVSLSSALLSWREVVESRRRRSAASVYGPLKAGKLHTTEPFIKQTGPSFVQIHVQNKADFCMLFTPHSSLVTRVHYFNNIPP